MMITHFLYSPREDLITDLPALKTPTVIAVFIIVLIIERKINTLLKRIMRFQQELHFHLTNEKFIIFTKLFLLHQIVYLKKILFYDLTFSQKFKLKKIKAPQPL